MRIKKFRIDKRKIDRHCKELDPRKQMGVYPPTVFFFDTDEIFPFDTDEMHRVPIRTSFLV